jgi:hypothetical protein
MSRLSIEFLEGALRTSKNPKVLKIHRLREEDELREEGFG